MTDVYLEVTYRDGRPWVAYLYLPRKKREKSDHCREVEPEMVLDINKQGKLIGIELLAPSMVTLEPPPVSWKLHLSIRPFTKSPSRASEALDPNSESRNSKLQRMMLMRSSAVDSRIRHRERFR